MGPEQRAVDAAGFAGAQMAKRGVPIRRRGNRLVFPVADEAGVFGAEIVVDLKPDHQESRKNEAQGSANPSTAGLADMLARGAASRYQVPMTRMVTNTQMSDRLTRVPKTIRYVFFFDEPD